MLLQQLPLRAVVMQDGVWQGHVLGLGGLVFRLLGQTGPTFRPDLLFSCISVVCNLDTDTCLHPSSALWLIDWWQGAKTDNGTVMEYCHCHICPMHLPTLYCITLHLFSLSVTNILLSLHIHICIIHTISNTLNFKFDTDYTYFVMNWLPKGLHLAHHPSRCPAK